jgi:hypothetical protein
MFLVQLVVWAIVIVVRLSLSVAAVGLGIILYIPTWGHSKKLIKTGFYILDGTTIEGRREREQGTGLYSEGDYLAEYSQVKQDKLEEGMRKLHLTHRSLWHAHHLADNAESANLYSKLDPYYKSDRCDVVLSEAEWQQLIVAAQKHYVEYDVPSLRQWDSEFLAELQALNQGVTNKV